MSGYPRTSSSTSYPRAPRAVRPKKESMSNPMHHLLSHICWNHRNLMPFLTLVIRLVYRLQVTFCPPTNASSPTPTSSSLHSSSRMPRFSSNSIYPFLDCFCDLQQKRNGNETGEPFSFSHTHHTRTCTTTTQPSALHPPRFVRAGFRMLFAFTITITPHCSISAPPTFPFHHHNGFKSLHFVLFALSLPRPSSHVPLHLK